MTFMGYSKYSDNNNNNSKYGILYYTCMYYIIYTRLI